METHTERIVNTVTFSPFYVSMPTLSKTTTLLSAVYGPIQALLEPHESSPFSPLIVSHTRALLELTNIFKKSLPLATTECTGNIIEDDDENGELLPEN